MARDQVRVVVRKPLADIEAEVRKRYGIRHPLLDISIEPDALALVFDGSPDRQGDSVGKEVPSSPLIRQPEVEGLTTKRRRKRRIRNRMKTRGWDVVGRFTNSKGQRCTIYRPILEAITGKGLTRRQAFGAVREVLLSNGNHPGSGSIEYFLNNTLEFISRSQTAEAER